MGDTRSRVAVFQPYLPGYRIAFFQRLRDALAHSGLTLEIYVSSKDSTSGDASDAMEARLVTDPLARLMGDRLHFRSEVLRVARDPHVAMVIIEQAAKYLDSVPLLTMSRRAPVGVWGHGGLYTNHRYVPARVRLFMSRRADWSFVYTQSGHDYLIQHGVPHSRISVLNNTIDTGILKEELACIDERDIATFRETMSLVEGRTTLYLGRLDADKDIDFLLASTRRTAQLLPGFTLLVGGDGPQAGEVRSAVSAGAPIRYLGRLDGRSKALAIRSSSAITIPGGVGLVAVEALVSGRPIITRDNHSHGPEADYLNRETQSVWLPSDCTPVAYGAAVASLLTATGLDRMQRACAQGAEAFCIDRMAATFHDGVLHCVQSGQKRSHGTA